MTTPSDKDDFDHGAHANDRRNPNVRRRRSDAVPELQPLSGETPRALLTPSLCLAIKDAVDGRSTLDRFQLATISSCLNYLERELAFRNRQYDDLFMLAQKDSAVSTRMDRVDGGAYFSRLHGEGLRMPPGILARLIGYANCNRCELTPEDSRFLAGVIDDLTRTTGTAPASASGTSKP